MHPNLENEWEDAAVESFFYEIGITPPILFMETTNTINQLETVFDP
jgi:hypothetical protein